MSNLFIGVIVPLSVLVPVIAGASRFKIMPSIFRIVFVYLIVAGLSNGIGVFLAKTGMNNMPILHIFTVAEFVLCSLFFEGALSKTKIRMLVKPIMLLFVLASIMNVAFWQSIFEYNYYMRSVETVLIILYSLSLFYKLLGNNQQNMPSLLPTILINSGLLIYFSGSFFLFLFPQLADAPRWIYNLGWVLHAGILLVMYLLFTIAFVKHKPGV